MSKKLEALRASGTIQSYSADEAVGIVVNQLMFVQRISRRSLGDVLGITGPAAGMKLRGDIGWSLDDLSRVSRYFGLSVADLVPEYVGGPAPEPGYVPAPVTPEMVGRAGLEPATQGL
ncbi:helix-turn-helix domain-containing protein [Acidipropionibacterium timonense]|uniref:helix-turn-helix domain-containing protein n=1 Tax=Acidipropionibacterium timonense TaxID=2161818 RepID=UPI0010302FDE